MTPNEQSLLAAARDGDEAAYQSLIEPHRGELHAHCYRMLGSVHDAEDSLQDALLRAWRGLPRFDGRSSLRSWLYRIATNTSLDTIAKRKKRMLPYEYSEAANPADELSLPAAEGTWIEPYPDEAMGLGSVADSPEGEGPAFFVCSASPRLVNGQPSKNPRYLQQRPDRTNAKATAVADLSSHLVRKLKADTPLPIPVDVVAAGRRNNPPDGPVPPLCSVNPLHNL